MNKSLLTEFEGKLLFLAIAMIMAFPITFWLTLEWFTGINMDVFSMDPMSYMIGIVITMVLINIIIARLVISDKKDRIRAKNCLPVYTILLPSHAGLHLLIVLIITALMRVGDRDWHREDLPYVFIPKDPDTRVDNDLDLLAPPKEVSK